MLKYLLYSKVVIKFVLEKTYSLELSIKTNATINKDILIKKLLVDICDLANA